MIQALVINMAGKYNVTSQYKFEDAFKYLIIYARLRGDLFATGLWMPFTIYWMVLLIVQNLRMSVELLLELSHMSYSHQTS